MTPRSRRSCGRCRAFTSRTVPDLERMTSDWVVAPWLLEVHALQQLAVGDAGGGEEAVVAGDEVVGVSTLVRS